METSLQVPSPFVSLSKKNTVSLIIQDKQIVDVLQVEQLFMQDVHSPVSLYVPEGHPSRQFPSDNTVFSSHFSQAELIHSKQWLYPENDVAFEQAIHYLLGSVIG